MLIELQLNQRDRNECISNSKQSLELRSRLAWQRRVVWGYVEQVTYLIFLKMADERLALISALEEFRSVEELLEVTREWSEDIQ